MLFNVGSLVRQHLTHIRLHKKQVTGKDEMNLVTIHYLWFKSYLNFIKWVADGMRGYYGLAIALNKLYGVSSKKINKKIHSTFSSVIFGLLSSTLTTHANLSSSDSSIIPAISEGIVVLNDLDLGFCRIILEVTSNNFIISFLSFVVNIFVNKVYIFYPQLTK